MLTSILDAGITKKIVRLGSRSTDERIAEYSLRNLEMNSNDGPIKDQIRREYAAKRNMEDEIRNVVKDIQIPEPSEVQIKEYLQLNWREHLSMMYAPQPWIVKYAGRLWESEEEGEWKVQGKKGKAKEQSYLMGRTYYGFWKRGLDIDFIQKPRSHPKKKWTKKQKGQNAAQQEQEAYQEWVSELFDDLGDSVPQVPTGNRPLVQLRYLPDVWSMSSEERKRLAEHWEEEMRRLAYDNYLDTYRDLRARYAEACEKFEAVSDEVRVKSALK